MSPDAPPLPVGILASRAVLALALLPMMLSTVLFVGSIGVQCSPGHINRADDELVGAAVAWLAFLAPAMPALLLGLGRPPPWRVLLAVTLAIGGGVLAVAMLGIAAVGHSC